MKLTRDQIVRLVLLGSAVVALLLLISSLSHVQLEPGLPFSSIWAFIFGDFSGFSRGGMGSAIAPSGQLIIDIIRALFFIALVVFPFAFILVMMDPDARKRALRALLQIAILLFIFTLFLQNQAGRLLEEDPLGGSLQPEGEGEYVPPLTDEEFDPMSVPAWLIWGASLLLGLLIAVILIIIINQIRKSEPEEDLPFAEIARRAQTAIDEIGRGGDLRSTILRCYAEMSRIVREERGLHRDRAVTAREFTDYLVRANLPRQPVTQLTRLFEKARYSSSAPTPSDEREALASLQAIVDACMNARASA